MAKEVLIPRYFGSETEYGFRQLPENRDKGFVSLYPPNISHIDSFLGNGGRLYPDMGHIEYATAECTTLEELVVHEIVGERIVWDAYGNDQSKAITIHKRTTTPDGKYTTGAHENYSTSVDIWQRENDVSLNALAAHFATRTVFIGSGHIEGDTFNLAQKMHDIEELAKDATTSSKPLVNKRRQSESGGSSLDRLHVTCGDANISPWVIRMKFGTTSLVLRLLENNVDLSDLTLANPVDAAKSVAGEIENINKPLLLRNGKFKSALGIQQALIERAYKLSESLDLPVEEKEVLDDWALIIDALHRYTTNKEPQTELQRLDWYTKKHVFERYENRHGLLTPNRRLRLSLLYDQIPNGIGVKLRQDEETFALYAPTEAQLHHAYNSPPEGRATMRGAIINRMHASRRPGSSTVGWGMVKLNGKTHNLPIDGDYSQAMIEERLQEIFQGEETKAA